MKTVFMGNNMGEILAEKMLYVQKKRHTGSIH